MTDTVLARGIAGLAPPMIADGRQNGTLSTSARGSDLPDFLDTGDPELCLRLPKLRGCFWTMDFAHDSDQGPDLAVREFGRPLGRLWGDFPPVAKPLLGDAGCSELLFRDFRLAREVWDFLPVWEEWGYLSAGVGNATLFRHRRMTGSHLCGSPVCHVSRACCLNFGRGL